MKCAAIILKAGTMALRHQVGAKEGIFRLRDMTVKGKTVSIKEYSEEIRY